MSRLPNLGLYWLPRRDDMAEWGIWGGRVMLFEREHGGGFCAPERYPSEALASFNTRDLPSFSGWLEAHDLRVKHAIGIDPGESADARGHSQGQLREALGALGAGKLKSHRAPEFCCHHSKIQHRAQVLR